MGAPDRPVVVCGGINLDIHARTEADRVIRHTSNPARIHVSPGGVGRNIAHDLAVLGVPVILLGATGEDRLSAQVLEETAGAGVDTSHVRRVAGRSVGMYVALLDGAGELDAAAADMSATEKADAAYFAERRAVLRTAALVVADANLPAASLQLIIDIAGGAGVPVILEPVSDAKARKLTALTGEVLAVTPNETEAAALSGQCPGLRVAHTLVTRGSRGVLWVDQRTGEQVELPALPGPVADVTGAGDAFVAGLVWGLREGAEASAGPAAGRVGRNGLGRDVIERALSAALAAARAVVGSEAPVLGRDDAHTVAVPRRRERCPTIHDS